MARCGQRLELAGFLHAQDQRRLRLVQVPPDEVTDLVDELADRSTAPGLHRLRLEPKRPPDPRDGGLAHPRGPAICPVDQWVSWRGGGSSRVLIITCSTWASVMVWGRAGRGRSDTPCSRWQTNRPRHRAHDALRGERLEERVAQAA